jgi:tetratricopeptide (TPR) repeat protein
MNSDLPAAEEPEKLPPEPEVVVDDDVSEVEEETGPERRHVRAWIYGLAVSLIVIFGAAREPWARGLALLLMGGVLIVAPPRVKLHPLPTVAMLLLALLPGLALLPAKYVGGVEEWRSRLGSEWGVEMPLSLTSEWWTTLESWLVMMIGVIWFWACLAQNFSDAGRRIVLRVLSFTGLLLAVMTLLDHSGWLDIVWWPRGDGHATSAKTATGFGPFANQNHSSSLFAWSCVLSAASALDALRRRSRSWMLLVAGICLLVSCILVNTSRAGLLLLILGMALWLGTAAMKRGFLRKLVVGLALAGTVISVVMVSGGLLGERLSEKPLTTAIGNDLRVWLAGQTLHAAAYAPWTGRGLGVFEHVFPQISTDPFPDSRTIHPESDVLWLLFEGGLLVLLPCLILVGWLYRTTGPWVSSGRKKRSHDSRAGRRVRRAFGIASGMALVHSIFDVPLHNLGYFAVFALVTAQAVRGRFLAERISPSVAFAFRVAGCLIVLWGGFWLALVAGWTEKAPASAAEVFHGRALRESAAGNRTEAMRLVNRAIALSPLEYRWYFLRAQFHLLMQHGNAPALEDFGRMRALEPHFGPICFDEGRVWLSYDPKMALIPWQEVMRRYPLGFDNAVPLYQTILHESAPYPELHRDLWKMADRPSLKLIFLSMQFVTGDRWQECVDDFLAEHPGLADLNKGQSLYLLNIWHHKGDRRQLVAYLEKFPQLQELGWRALAHHRAQSGKFEEAYRLAERYLPPQVRSAILTAADIPRLERLFILNPVDPLPGVELYYAQRAAGDLKSARRTLEKVMTLPKSPEFLNRELASVLAETGDMRGAWEMIQKNLEAQPIEMSVMDDDMEVGDGFSRPIRPRAKGTPLEEASRDDGF